MSQWISVKDRLPNMLSGSATELLVCVVASGGQFVFSAQWLCGFDLYSEDHPDANDDGLLEGHGWYSVKESAECAGWYESIVETAEYKITHWMPLPTPPAK